MPLSGSRTIGVAVKASTMAPPKYVTTRPSMAPQKIVTSKLASHVVFIDSSSNMARSCRTFWLSVSKQLSVCKLIYYNYNLYLMNQ